MGTRDPTINERPVKDEVPASISEAKERQIVASLTREELEDRYLRLREEQSSLKKNSHKQEEKMKQMATKLLRLVKDRKKFEEGVTVVDSESCDKIDELQTTVNSLQKQNSLLKNRLMVAKQQLQTHGKKPTPYDHIQSRVNAGKPIKKAPTVLSKQQRIQQQIRIQGSPPPPARDIAPQIGSPHSRESPRVPPPILPQPRYGHSLLEESRLEKQELDNLVASLQEQLLECEEKIDYLQEELYRKDVDYEEDLQKLRQRVSGTQRTTIQENVELIKLQREVKEKVSKLQHFQGKYKNLEELLHKVKLSHGQVLEEMEGLTVKLKEEQMKNGNLKTDLKHGSISQKTLAQKEEQISDLKAEIELLKDAHEKLLHSTFDVERDREFRAKEKQYMLRIAQLEATIKCDVSEKNEVLDRLTSERDVSHTSQSQMRELQVSYYALKEKHEELTEKLKFFTNESSCDFEEMQEALILVKTRKEKASQDLDFLGKVDENINKDLRIEVDELQANHADTINELEKTRSMLVLQHNINKDYQKEVELTTKKMEELKRECDLRVKEYAELLDIRAQRIKKLEAQLKDVAYGTKQYRLKPEDMASEDLQMEDGDVDVNFDLERGENVFEIHIGKVLITDEGLALFGNMEPASFLSFEFFEYELQATPVARGASIDFNHTSQYKVKVDDFFLHYLQKESMQVDFHKALGTEYCTLAKSSIQFAQLLDRSSGRLLGNLTCLSMDDGKSLAHVEYWIRLCVPMEQALRLYKERTKALGYVTSKDLKQLESPNVQLLKDSSINELKINLIACYNLVTKNKDRQPSAYCVYKFFDFADHDTDIVSHSNSPQFHDEHLFPVPMTEELDNYLKNCNLEVYVFDDLDPDITSYIGMATVPLITLSQDKSIAGQFQIQSSDSGLLVGILEASFSWQYTYLPASAKKVRTYPMPLSMASERTDSFIKTPTQRDMMLPIVTSGKLLEPAVDSTQSVEHEEPVLKPSFERERHEMMQNHAQISRDDSLFSGILPESSSKNLHNVSKAMSLKELAPVEETDTRNVERQTSKKTEERYPRDFSASRSKANDTMFEEEELSVTTDEDVMIPASARIRHHSIPVVIPTMEDSASDVTTGEENAMVASSYGMKRRPDTVDMAGDTVTIIVSSLTLYDTSVCLDDDNIQQLYVSYKFLNYDTEETETPISLPKPNPFRPISFNYMKVFHLNERDHSRQHLMHLLMPDSDGCVKFTVVSEPADDDMDCVDVGEAVVDLVQLLREDRDFIDEEVSVVDLMTENSGTVIGSLTLTFQVLAALKSFYE